MDARTKLLATVIALLTLGSLTAAGAQDPAPAPATEKASVFTAEQLEQIVAPIALHPDSLLTMIMMSSTYPLEIVEAYRWVTKNASLKGTALEEALKAQDWDPSVKSICVFPTVLKQMNDNLDWTQDLGDAFLGQKAELMQTVQKMRRKALEAGTLKSSEQQKISEDGTIIIIESTKTEVVYVPTYSPTVVYGPSWYYPTYYYPPMYVAPRPGAVLFAFSVGVMWGAGCWGGCNWHGNDVNININNFNSFNKNTNINAGKYNINNAGGNQGSWNHNPEHRKGANYKNPATAQKYGAAGGSNRVTKDQARGYGGATPNAGANAGRGAGASPSPAATRPSAGNSGAGVGAGAGAGARAKPAASGGGGGGSALSGSRAPSVDRSASARGAASRGGGGGRGRGR
jgi:hypothetical protein